jgi:hypothetical protein
MSFSKVQLSSNALILLGDSPISSFTEEGAGAVTASNLYESSYLSILSSHRWNFATKKATLAKLTALPKNEYKYQFQMPTDIVMLITTYPTSTYRILGDKLYSNSNAVEIDYIYKITEDKFPAYFVKAFEFYLASQFAIPITEDLNKADIMQRFYERESRKARYADSQSQPAVPIQDDPYIRVRVI